MRDLLEKARGEKPAELVFKGGRIADVFSGRLFEADLAVDSSIILGAGDYCGETEIDLGGRILAPGFIDSHLHIESSMLRVEEFARLVLPRGTTTVIADPHEIANVVGRRGILYMLSAGRRLPWNYYIMLPPCVPASDFETSGAVLSAADLKDFMGEKEVLGLGEMMDFCGVITGSQDRWQKLSDFEGYFRDGHAPGVTGNDLNAYLLGGIQADHEMLTPDEVREKVQKGMYIMLREGSASKDLDTLIRGCTPQSAGRFLLATDDRHLEDIMTEGHINYLLQKVTQSGWDPITALRMATLNPAQACGLFDVRVNKQVALVVS